MHHTAKGANMMYAWRVRLCCSNKPTKGSLSTEDLVVTACHGASHCDTTYMHCMEILPNKGHSPACGVLCCSAYSQPIVYQLQRCLPHSVAVAVAQGKGELFEHSLVASACNMAPLCGVCYLPLGSVAALLVEIVLPDASIVKACIDCCRRVLPEKCPARSASLGLPHKP